MCRYTGTTVDTNFANIQKLPRVFDSVLRCQNRSSIYPGYAKFGKLGAPGSAEPPAPPPAATGESGISHSRVPLIYPIDEEPKTSGPTTRRSNTGPVTDIFGGDFTSAGDALSLAPPKPESEEVSCCPLSHLMSAI